MADHQKIDISRLKRVLIENTGPTKQWTRRGLSLAAGMGPDGVRDILSGRSRNPKIETLAGLASVLGKEVSVFLVDEPTDPQHPREMVQVIGAVAAGVWREDIEWSTADRFWIGVTPSPVRGAERFALVIEGYSMDKLFAPGAIVDCIRVFGAPVKPEPGDLVIVERTRNDLREMTCKRLWQRDDGDYELRSESSRPEFADPIFVGHPDRESVSDDETRIIGIVVGAYENHFRRR